MINYVNSHKLKYHNEKLIEILNYDLVQETVYFSPYQQLKYYHIYLHKLIRILIHLI